MGQPTAGDTNGAHPPKVDATPERSPPPGSAGAAAVRTRLPEAESPHKTVGASLPLVDEFRTLCVAPNPQVRGVFEGLESIAA